MSGTSVIRILMFALVLLGSLDASAEPELATAHAQTCDLIVRSEITIDRPVKDVWPYFLELDAWMSHLHFETIKGRKGEEGQVRRVTLQGDTPYHPYLVTTVRVTPLNQYVLKITSEEGPQYFGFADFSFTPHANKTRLIYAIYVELSLPDKSEDQAREFCNQQHERTRRDVSVNSHNLKSLVEASVSRRSR